jgi:transposase
LGFGAPDRQRLARTLRGDLKVRLFRRLQAVWLVAQDRPPAEAAHVSGLSLRSVYNVVGRYLHAHCPWDLADEPRPGRPRSAPELTPKRILRALRRSPLKLGYRTNVWTVGTLALYLNERYHGSCSAGTLRRRMKQSGLACKRPRYFYSERDPHVAQKKGGLGATFAGPVSQGRVALRGRNHPPTPARTAARLVVARPASPRGHQRQK